MTGLKTTTMIAVLCLAVTLGGCRAGHIQLQPQSIDAAGLAVARSLIVNPIEFRFDDPSLQESSHTCMWSMIPLCLWRQMGRGCNGNAFLLRPAKVDSPELIPERIGQCIAESLRASGAYQSVRLFKQDKWTPQPEFTPLILQGEITECREVGYGTVYGLSVPGALVCWLVPLIPTNYGNHIKFNLDLKLTDTQTKALVWSGSLTGETKHRIRTSWMCRDIVHGSNDFDKRLSAFLQERLPVLLADMVKNAKR